MTADERQRTREFLQSDWPPLDAQALYNLGWTTFKALGKQAALRAAIAAYEVTQQRLQETDYDRLARRAAEAWVIEPSEENRLAAGRIASSSVPSRSGARTIAHIAGSNRRWPGAIGICLAGNPRFLPAESFAVICDAIHRELLAWSTGREDPVAQRHNNEPA